MSTAIDDTLSKFIEKLQHEGLDGVAAGTGQGQEQAPVQERPAVQERTVSSRPSNQRRVTMYGRIVTALIVLLLVATGVSYYLYRVEREAITSRIDAIVRAPLAAPLEDQLLELQQKLVASSRANEMRFQVLEQRLTDKQQAYGQQLQDMEQRLVQMHEPQEQRLQQVEQRLASMQQPDGKRMQAIENRLVEITARMDGWAAVVADLSEDGQSVAPLQAATVAEPPAERAIEPMVVARNNTVLQPTMPKPKPKPKLKPVPDAAPDKPPLAAAASTAQVAQGVRRAQGDWVINIGSYMREKIAARKLAEFGKQGVSAELVTATVRGKTIYRVQVPGFVSMAEARDHASQVRETLGLKETWIRRR